ncbi:MAG: efflux RND transporter periplasmic adaptor subunit [Sandaracinaceae bacterium]
MSAETEGLAMPGENPAAGEAAATEGETPWARRLMTAGIILGILAIGAAGAAMLIMTAPQAQRAEQETRGTPVRVMTLRETTAPIRVRAQGTVVPAQQVVLQPEVTGRVVWAHPDLVPGGRVAAGDTLLRLDARDYRAAVEQQRATVENNRLALQQEQSRRVVAQREWALLGSDSAASSPEGQRLALREPQLRAAEASLHAAASALSQARTNLARTTVDAPFDALVLEESADLGQLVSPSSQVATLVASDVFWIRVAVPLDKVSWIRFPSDGQPGSEATVWQEVGESGRIERRGRVVRLLGDLDPVGRMARVLIEIDEPLARDPDAPPGDTAALPLFLQALAQVEIEAGTLDHVIEIPRAALHQDREVFLYGDDDRLEIRPVEVAWRRQDTVLVRGVEAGEQLVTSRVPTPIAGTLLQRAEDGSEAPGAAVADVEAGP